MSKQYWVIKNSEGLYVRKTVKAEGDKIVTETINFVKDIAEATRVSNPLGGIATLPRDMRGQVFAVAVKITVEEINEK